MKKRIISALLVFVMLCSLLPLGVLADSTSPYSTLKGYNAVFKPDSAKEAISTQMYVVSQSTQSIAPGITGTDVYFNDASGDNQVAGYMTTMDLSSGSVKIKATYKGFYNGTDSSKWSISKWGMQTLTEQAAAYEAATGENVVAATNGDYFNMQTGQPLGVLIMNGVNCNPNKTAAEPYFAILKDGTAVIRDKGTPVNDVAEAISSPAYLVKDGVNMISAAETDLIPGNSIGIDDRGNVITYIADGRQKPYSRGISRYELAEFWIAQGVKNVLYLDGGGSATCLAAEGNAKGALQLRNSPSDGYERAVSSGLLIVSTAAPATGVFGGATVYTSSDSYPKGSVVEFGANCVDTAGYGIDVDCTWQLAAASAGMGTIDSKTGVFTSNGTAGKVTAELVYGGKAVAEKTVSITSSSDYSAYTGFISENGSKSFLVNGELITGWFIAGKEMYHAGADGIVHNTTTKDTRTCLNNGRIVGRCSTCGDVYNGQALWSIGHKWDDRHVCTRCGAVGIDINRVTVPDAKFYNYTGKQITPAVNNLTYNGKTLDVRSSRYGTDGYVSYDENVNVGMGYMTVEGRGNYYGTLELSFYIVPGGISQLYAKDVKADSATLSWDSAAGASSYIVEQNINGSWSTIATVNSNTYKITDLTPGTDYEYRVAWKASINNTTYYYNRNSRPVVSFKTPNIVSNFSCVLDNGQIIVPAIADGELYLLLPSGTDLTKLVLAADDGSAISVSGDKGSIDAAEAFDLTDIATLNNGAYTVTVTTGDNQVSAKIMVSDKVGAIFLTSSDAENAGRSYVDAVKGNTATGSMLFMAADGSTVIYDGALTQIKSRGNSSFVYSPKKAYQIKLESKTDLLGNGEKGKTWVLLANYMDATAIRDKLFKDLAAKMGMQGAPDCSWVDLYYDGEYRGTYLLSEKASIGKTTVNITDMEDAYSEVNDNYGDNAEIKTSTNTYGDWYCYTDGLAEPKDITGGYLLEVNGDRGVDEASGFKTKQGYDINVKSPEFAGRDAMIYISEYFQEFEDAVYAQDEDGNYTGYNKKTGKYFYEYCDMDSLVKMYLIQHIAASPDGFHASLYFYKDAGKIMYAGPIWDMDLSLGAGMTGDIQANNKYITVYRYLSQALIQIPEFKQAVKAYFVSDFKPLIQELINSGIDEYADAVNASVAMDNVLWPFVRSGKPDCATHLYGDDVSYADIISDTKGWLSKRLVFTEDTVSHEHKYNKTETAATCTKDGSVTHKCSVCGAVKEIVIPAAGHEYVNGKCTRCGDLLNPFTDIGDLIQEFQDSIIWAYSSTPQITTGYNETEFKPNAVCNRAQVVTFLWRAAGSPEPDNGANPFADVSESGACAPYYKAILWAAEKGITTGFDDTHFKPFDSVTRAQFVTFLWRYEGKLPPTAGSLSFTDAAQIAAPYREAVAWGAENGIISGYPDGSFRPNNPCTRAHVTTFLYRDMT